MHKLDLDFGSPRRSALRGCGWVLLLCATAVTVHEGYFFYHAMRAQESLQAERVLLEKQLKKGEERSVGSGEKLLSSESMRRVESAFERIARGADDSGYPPSLDILANGAKNQRDPQGGLLRFLRKVPRDPLNNDMTLSAAKTWGKRSYASPHDAPVEGRDVFDVYSLEPGNGLNGVPYREW